MGAVVVSDCSPVRALHHLKLLLLFEQLYGTVILPEAVRRELLNATKLCPSIDVHFYPFLQVRSPAQDPRQLGVPDDLDPGESEAIALAIELHAALLLIDERKGTQAARDLGLVTIGVFGMLLEAKKRNLVPKLLPLTDQLASGLGFFMSQSLRSKLATLAGE